MAGAVFAEASSPTHSLRHPQKQGPISGGHVRRPVSGRNHSGQSQPTEPEVQGQGLAHAASCPSSPAGLVRDPQLL